MINLINQYVVQIEAQRKEKKIKLRKRLFDLFKYVLKYIITSLQYRYRSVRSDVELVMRLNHDIPWDMVNKDNKQQ